MTGRVGAIVRAMDRELWVLMAGFFATNAGYFMVIPLVSIYTTRDLGLSAAAAGLVVAVGVGVQKSLGLFTGLLADRLGRRRMLLAGLMVRVAGLLAFLPARGLGGLLLAAALVGLGGATFGPPIRAGLAARATPQNRQTLFVGRSLANDLGATVGPLLGAVLALYDTRLAFIVSALAHAALATAACRWVRNLGTEDGTGRPTLPRLFRTVAADRLLWRFGALAVLFTVLYSQLTLTLPLRAGQLAGTAAAAAAAASLFTVNALSSIAMQAVWIPYSARVPARTAFGAGALLCAAGIVAAGLAPSLPLLYGAVVVFTAGEILAFPAADTLVADISPPASLASYYGVFNLAWAVGASAGSVLGGWALSGAGAGPAAVAVWSGFLAAGLAVAVVSQTTRWTSPAPAVPAETEAAGPATTAPATTGPATTGPATTAPAASAA